MRRGKRRGTVATLHQGREPTMNECPVCGGDVELPRDPVEGELLECSECASELEILGLAPVVLAEAPEAEEDWGE